MLSVDHQTYDRSDFRARYDEMHRLETFRNPEGLRYALCLKHAFDTAAAILYIKERGGSVLLLPDTTPLETAVDLANRANCAYLLYQVWDCAKKLEVINKSDVSGILQFSSGTTREPALITRSWDHVETEIHSYNERLSDLSGSIPIILVPVSHSFGLITGMLAAMARGEQPLIIQNKNPKFMLRLIRNTAEHTVYAVPYHFSLLDTLGKGEVGIRRMIISGAPPADPLFKRMTQTAEVWQQYGCTEAGCISLARQPASTSDVGQPLHHHRLQIVELEDGSAGEGEIVVLTAGHKVATGDLGYVDPSSGRLHVKGRIDDLINVSGYKVIPSEVELIIANMPGVHESVVYKTAHPVQGEAVRAMVIASPGVTDMDVRLWCIKHLPNYKVPGAITMVSDIPRTSAGKISRKYLQTLER